jgi:hypothetical protein
MSQTRIKHRIPAMEVVDFVEGSTTERGEKVYKSLRITFKPCFGAPYVKVFQCDPGIGITEEWIEDTVLGCMEALAKDYPMDAFNIVRIKPNDISFEYSGTRGVVN